MEIKSHKKMYKAGKQWVSVAVATTAAGVAFVAANESASADVWQANPVDQVAAQVSANGGINNYQIQNGDTVWALAMATNDSVAHFASVNGIVNPDLIIAGQSFNGATAATATSASAAAPTQTAYTPAASDSATSAANDAAASEAAASQAAASSQAASEAYAASVAASVASSQAAAASMAAAESHATAASEAAAKAAESQALAAAAQSSAAAQSAASVSSSVAAASAAAVASSQANAASQATASQQSSQTATTATSSTAGDVDNATFNALKSLRSGMTTEWSSDLAAQAQARAQQIANNGGSIPSEHWSNANEVISIGFGAGSSVVNAWYNETNMTTASGTGHRDWEMRASSTHFGFAQVGNVIVGISD
ncbi:LysM peptidoglycan-binding domain-containing protein [Weissella paramesenteroides]|uniref:CAP domain-containing protein n=1 Tax=Weissella paramesenteroides TaxID=1249 RepID=UPI00123BB9FF|nr:CAP domain-containing protein [Weissella paramesenteroides]KAA8442528.1 LysM peptidoglycan-binding domain-containing protein [Weissella paramesenteroides]KAA8442875.1 LysM peptidoglycan-binding domain-containing protein [Weissella paramesenteroides]KAA8444450.1 LysM peptidoglycan-binding domain-containing protein [Weissella paramesenteroides]KAA8448117.1 LysM peptidoglycan-binding domain-containing protein [Weissella paramesenteroides]KAA8452071.1 LysM peptidoglycan-binding domain-containin